LAVMRRPWWNQVRCSGSSRIAASACARPSSRVPDPALPYRGGTRSGAPAPPGSPRPPAPRPSSRVPDPALPYRGDTRSGAPAPPGSSHLPAPRPGAPVCTASAVSLLTIEAGTVGPACAGGAGRPMTLARPCAALEHCISAPPRSALPFSYYDDVQVCACRLCARHSLAKQGETLQHHAMHHGTPDHACA